MASLFGGHDCTNCCPGNPGSSEVLLELERKKYAAVGMAPHHLDVGTSGYPEDDPVDDIPNESLSSQPSAKTKSGSMLMQSGSLLAKSGSNLGDEVARRPALSEAAARARAVGETAEPDKAPGTQYFHIGSGLASVDAGGWGFVGVDQSGVVAVDEHKETAEEAAPDGPSRFRIRIDKGDGQKKLGLDTLALVKATGGLLKNERGALRVQAVKPEGLVSEWNSLHQKRQIKSGDFILEVNGVRGTAEELYKVIAQDIILEIQLLRLP